jgi:hypothetical protein
MAVTEITVKDASGDPQVVALPVVRQVAGLTKIAGASLTRPANTTAYALGDLIANSATAGSVTPLAIAAARENDATGMLRKVRLSTDNVAWANNTVRVHLFKNSPTSTVGDNGVFAAAINGVASIHLGYFDVIFDQVFSDGVKGEGVPNTGGEINFDPAAGTQNIYALIEVRGAYTPTSGQAFALAVEVLQN